jgi:hypothetical protein
MINAERQEQEIKKARLRRDRLAHKRELERTKEEAADSAKREALMIWFLVNTATGQNEANEVIQQIARALELRPGQINAKRTRAAARLSIRSKHLLRLSDGGRWAAIPGSQGTELPDFCQKCGGMKTEGRRCRRKTCR